MSQARGTPGLLPDIPAEIFARITLTGTSAPTFYKIPVTFDLLYYSITTGQFMPLQTVVHKLIPPVPNMASMECVRWRIGASFCRAFRKFA